MNDDQRTARMALLVAVHLVVSIVLAMVVAAVVVAQQSSNQRPPFWISSLGLVYHALLTSQCLLLGMWIGLPTTAFRTRVIGFVLSVAWILAVSIPQLIAVWPHARHFVDFAARRAIEILVIAGGFALCRRFVARIEYRAEWPEKSKSVKLRFSLRSMLLLTAGVATLLAGREIVKAAYDYYGDFIARAIPLLLTLVLTCLMFWAILGVGSLKDRLARLAFVGIVLTYVLLARGINVVHWLSTTVCTLGISLSSLLVIRSSGYRLVSVRRNRVEADGGGCETSSPW